MKDYKKFERLLKKDKNQQKHNTGNIILFYDFITIKIKEIKAQHPEFSEKDIFDRLDQLIEITPVGFRYAVRKLNSKDNKIRIFVPPEDFISKSKAKIARENICTISTIKNKIKSWIETLPEEKRKTMEALIESIQ